MPSYTVTAVNIGTFNLGEADKVLTLFTREKGIVRAVAKGARKPGTKMAGRADVLNINKLLLSSGRTFEIITQAEGVSNFPEFRTDLQRLSYGLYYAELTQHFGQGLSEESESYFDYIAESLRLLSGGKAEPSWLSLEFELGLLDLLGYKPELTFCVNCRSVLGDYNISMFNKELGGVVCTTCQGAARRMMSGEPRGDWTGEDAVSWKEGTAITPLVWKNLVLASERRVSASGGDWSVMGRPLMQQPVLAGRRLIQGYIEHRAGKRMKALDLVADGLAR